MTQIALVSIPRIPLIAVENEPLTPPSRIESEVSEASYAPIESRPPTPQMQHLEHPQRKCTWRKTALFALWLFGIGLWPAFGVTILASDSEDNTPNSEDNRTKIIVWSSVAGCCGMIRKLNLPLWVCDRFCPNMFIEPEDLPLPL